MKFVCPQSELNTHLSVVSRAVPSRPSRPVLANVLVTADETDQRVSLVGFDESLGITTRFEAAVDVGGILTLPAKLLGDIVARLPNEEISIELEDDEATVLVTCSSGHYQVRGLSAEDYPNLPTIEGGTVSKLSGEALIEGLRGTLFSASADETKQVLTGVHLISSTESLEFAATDGHRLAVVQTEDDQNPVDGDNDGQAMDVTIPGKAMREVERILQSYPATEAIALQFDQTQVIFDMGSQKITTRLLEGQYPNYRQLIPRKFERQMTLDRRQFATALERIAVLAEQKNNIVKLTLDSGAQTLAISVEAQDVGSGREEIPAQITGEDLEIAFNVRYLLDGIKVLPSAEVQLQCNTATSPAILTPLGGFKMTYLVMPVQIRS
ncbi:MAG: DNA polymerase III subunit beta [Cyanobacteria bacterium P01_D01_bin.128]